MSKKKKSKKTENKKVKSGQTVSIHYVGTLDDGTEFDNSRSREQPLSVHVGGGQVIPGFDEALSGMLIGEVKKVTLSPDRAYGDVNPQAFQAVKQSAFPDDFAFEVGGVVQGQNPSGEPVHAVINSVNEDTIVLDFNHPLAGKNLNFEIELLEVK